MESPTVLRVSVLRQLNPTRPPRLEHRVEDGQQFPHAGRQREFLGLAGLPQATAIHAHFDLRDLSSATPCESPNS